MLEIPRYPLILCHGIFEPSHFRLPWIKMFRSSSWDGVSEYLSEKGCKVEVSRVPSFSPIHVRSWHLYRFLQKLKASGKYPDNKFNLVCHSMGGLDARYLVHLLKNTLDDIDLLSVTTLGTPHRGTVIADKWVEILLKKSDLSFQNLGGSSSVFRKVLVKILSGVVSENRRHEGFAKECSVPAPSFFNLPDVILSDSCFPAEDSFRLFIHSIYHLTTHFLTIFNKNVPNNPNVCYRSYGGDISDPVGVSELGWPFRTYHKYLMDTSGGNDGLVPYYSSIWDNSNVSTGRPVDLIHSQLCRFVDNRETKSYSKQKRFKRYFAEKTKSVMKEICSNLYKLGF